MPFITHTTKKITSIKGSYGCPRWFDAVYNSDLEYIKKHSKNVNKVRKVEIFSFKLFTSRGTSSGTELSTTRPSPGCRRWWSCWWRLGRTWMLEARTEPLLSAVLCRRDTTAWWRLSCLLAPVCWTRTRTGCPCCTAPPARVTRPWWTSSSDTRPGSPTSSPGQAGLLSTPRQ